MAGSLLAVGTVVVVAAGFANPSFHRLPGEDEFSGSGVSLAGAETSTHHHHHHQEVEEEEEEQQNLMDSSGSGMCVYSCHLPSDVIWAPIARLPPPY